jgi:hypothetical protein
LSQMFAIKAGAYPIGGSSERCFTQVGSAFIHKHKDWVGIIVHG